MKSLNHGPTKALLSIIVLLNLMLAACGGTPISATQVINGGGTGGGTGGGSGGGSGPTISLSATPVLVAIGGTSVITWSSTNSTSCTSSPAGINGISGTFTTPSLNLTTNNTYTVTCVGPDGTTSSSITIAIATTSTLGDIATVQATYTSMPPLSGTVYHYCDCGTGAAAGCVAGNDSTGNGTASNPYRTIAAAITKLNSLSSGQTVALCQGGAFIATGALSVTNNVCTPGAGGSPNYCVDFREYSSPYVSSTAKPIIQDPAGFATWFLTFQNSVGGIRVMNLDFEGVGGSDGAVFLYSKTANTPTVHDILFANNTFNFFNLAMYDATGIGGITYSKNISWIGNTVTNNVSMGYLGGGTNQVINYNYMLNNGGNSAFNHQIYISGHYPSSNFQIHGNYIYGQSGATCTGNMIGVHGEITGLDISNNYIGVDPSAGAGGCWTISLDDGGYTAASYFRSVTITGNTILAGGNLAIQVSHCPSCLIDNNLVEMNWPYSSAPNTIVSGNSPYRATYGDDVNNANQIINNTIWVGPTMSSGAVGPKIETEGTGHIVANNAVYYSASTGGSSVYCYDYPLALTSYAFINNNNCWSVAGSPKWEGSRVDSLATWQITGFDSASFASDPNFTSVGTNFIPASGSPLLGAGTPTGTLTDAPATDITGTARPNPPAIGAFE